MIELFSLGDIKTELQQLSRVVNVDDTLGGVNNRHIPHMEKKFSHLTGRDAAAVNSCTNGLYLSLRRLNLNQDPVLLPPIVFFGVAGAVQRAGGIPILSRTDKDGLMDLGRMDEILSKEFDGKKIKAVIPAHINGRYVDVDAIEKSVTIIEDSAPAFGVTKKNGRCLISDTNNVSVISFSFAKPLTAGEGGVIFSDPEMGKWIRSHRYCGLDDLVGRYGIGNFDVHDPELKFPFHALGANLISIKLKSFEKNLERRRRIAGFYNEYLADKHDAVFYPGGNHLTYMISTLRRKKVEKALEEAGVGFYYNHRPVYRFSAFKNLPQLDDTVVSSTDAYFNRVLHIPAREDLSDAEVEKIKTVVLKSLS